MSCCQFRRKRISNKCVISSECRSIHETVLCYAWRIYQMLLHTCSTDSSIYNRKPKIANFLRVASPTNLLLSASRWTCCLSSPLIRNALYSSLSTIHTSAHTEYVCVHWSYMRAYFTRFPHSPYKSDISYIQTTHTRTHADWFWVILLFNENMHCAP